MKNLLVLIAALGATFAHAAADGAGTSAAALVDTTDHDGSAMAPLVETRVGIAAATEFERTIDTAAELGTLLLIR